MVALGRCEEDARAAFHPFAELVRHLVEHGPERWFGETGLLAQLALAFGSVGRRFPAVAPVAASDQDSDRLRVAEAMKLRDGSGRVRGGPRLLSVGGNRGLTRRGR